METLLQYYLPGLDVSSLSETEFIKKVGWLLRIRQMEQAEQLTKTLNKLLSGE